MGMGSELIECMAGQPWLLHYTSMYSLINDRDCTLRANQGRHLRGATAPKDGRYVGASSLPQRQGGLVEAIVEKKFFLLRSHNFLSSQFLV